MRNLRIFRLACLITACAPGLNALAQEPGDLYGDAAEALRRYSVEMIVFAYAEDVAVGSEVFVPDLVVADDEDDEDDQGLQDTYEDVPTGTPDSADLPEIDVEIRSLRRDELTMMNTLERLERLDAYEPLMHFGWSQITVVEEQSPVLPLARFGTPPAGLDGSLKLYLSRFLHLVVDVSLLAPERDNPFISSRPRVDAPVGRYGDARSGNERTGNDYDRRDVSPYEYEPLRFRIFEDRIMKNGDTRYYDHPKIGVIAKVTRIEENPDPVDSVRR